MIDRVITDLASQYKRRSLTRRNLVYYLWRFAGNGVRTCRAVTAPIVYRETRAIAETLSNRGIVVGPSSGFLTEQGIRLLDEATRQLLEVSRRDDVQAIINGTATDTSRQKDFLIHLASFEEGLPADHVLLKLALDPKLLEIVSRYLGLWPCLHSVGAWLNYPTNDPAALSQLWHRDPEDLRLVKVFIYLSDVGEQSGPFTYIPETHPFGRAAVVARKYEKKKRLPDEQMQRLFPPESWRVCTGPAHTMILADTIGYHRGGKPTEGHRTLITFTYTSALSFVDRPMRIVGEPTWIAAPIQEYAARALRAARPPAPKKKKKS